MSLGSDSAQNANLEDVDAIPGPGTLVVGKYLVERTIGVGGMGVVVAARHKQLNHLVAIKFLNEKTTQSGTGTARFLREARAAASLKSEHVAHVIDVGTLESGAPFMVMEYLEGKSLSRLIRKRAPLPVYQSVDLIVQACDALGEAHELGIIHRDIKPSNLFLTKRTDGSTMLKVLDFGISKAPKATDESEPTLTDSYMVLGSPQYLSPEQIIDVRSVDQRTDVWALGVVLYYMLAGVRPFEEDTVAALCVAIATKVPLRLIEHRPDITPDFDEVVMRCLQKDRQHRMPSVAELTRALAPFASLGTRVSVDHFSPPSSRLDVPSNVRAFSADSPSSQRPQTVGSSVIVPEGPGHDLALPMAPTELMVRPRDSQNSVIAVQALPRGPSTTWLPIAAGVVVAAALGVLLVSRIGDKPADEMGAVGPVGPANATESAPGAKVADPQEQGVVPDRTPLVRGPDKPVASSKPGAKKPDYGSLLEANKVVTSVAQLRLLDRAGGNQVIGVVPKDEIVMVKKIAGEWCLVTYVDKTGSVTSGWTMRNLVQ